MGFWDVVASAGPYANNLHLAPNRQPHQHLITQFLQAGCSSRRPTNSIKALKAKKPIDTITKNNQKNVSQVWHLACKCHQAYHIVHGLHRALSHGYYIHHRVEMWKLIPVVTRYWLLTPGWSTSCITHANIVANISRSVNTFWTFTAHSLDDNHT